MEKEAELLGKLIDFLESKKGFPRDTLIQQMSVGDKYQADLVAVDPDTKEPIGIFELKIDTKQNQNFEAISQLKTYTKALGIPDISSFIVTDTGPDHFMVHQYHDGQMMYSIPELIPSYETLRNKNETTNKTRIKAQQKSTVDHFKISCYVAAFVVFVILLLDVFKVFTFNAQQLSLLGLVVALVLIPYAAKLKVLGIEFERFKAEKKP